MGVIIGSEALAAGMVTRNDLRRRYTRMFPDVYGPPKPTIRERARGAWLWSGRRGVIAGVAASALHWAKYVDDDVPIELLIGAEGGLAPDEIDSAMQAGYVGVRLGPRILRTETAGLAALAAIQSLWGDLTGG